MSASADVGLLVLVGSVAGFGNATSQPKPNPYGVKNDV